MNIHLATVGNMGPFSTQGWADLAGGYAMLMVVIAIVVAMCPMKDFFARVLSQLFFFFLISTIASAVLSHCSRKGDPKYDNIPAWGDYDEESW